MKCKQQIQAVAKLVDQEHHGEVSATSVSESGQSKACLRLPLEIWGKICDELDGSIEERHIAIVNICIAFPPLYSGLARNLRMLSANETVSHAIRNPPEIFWQHSGPKHSPALRQACKLLVEQREFILLPFEGRGNYRVEGGQWVGSRWESPNDYSIVPGAPSTAQYRIFHNILHQVGPKLVCLDLSHTDAANFFRLKRSVHLDRNLVGSFTYFGAVRENSCYEAASVQIASSFQRMTSLRSLKLKGKEIPAKFVEAIPFENMNLDLLDVSGTLNWGFGFLMRGPVIRHVLAKSMDRVEACRLGQFIQVWPKDLLKLSVSGAMLSAKQAMKSISQFNDRSEATFYLQLMSEDGGFKIIKEKSD